MQDAVGAPELTVLSPATGAEVGRAPIMGRDAVIEQVRAARTAQPAWGALEPSERARSLDRLRHGIVRHARTLAELSCAETGKLPVEALMVDVLTTCDLAAWYSRNVSRVQAAQRVSAGWMVNKRAWIVREPYGVVGVIGPWNFPILNTMRAVMAGLVTGNAVILKPSEATPLTALRLREIALEAGIPEGIFQVAPGDGGTGRALVEAGVDKLSFTGSVATGRKVAVAAMERLIPVTLELGGKDPAIVLPDADVERAARFIANGAFWNAGQICISLERAYVTEPVYDSFVDALVRETRALHVGPPDDARSDVGAMTTEAQIEIVERQVADAVRRGARVLTGGHRIEGGRFYQPTVLVDVTDDMDVMREETFGPVLPVVRVRDTDEAVRRANGGPFALGASVWGGRRRASAVAGQLRAGMVCVNDALVNGAIPGLPFGGAGESGFGRVYGEDGLRELTRPRSFLVDRGGLNWEPGRFPLAKWGVQRSLALIRLLHAPGLRARFGGLLSILRGR